MKIVLELLNGTGGQIIFRTNPLLNIHFGSLLFHAMNNYNITLRF